jgi:hypothetical protein
LINSYIKYFKICVIPTFGQLKADVPLASSSKFFSRSAVSVNRNNDLAQTTTTTTRPSTTTRVSSITITSPPSLIKVVCLDIDPSASDDIKRTCAAYARYLARHADNKTDATSVTAPRSAEVLDDQPQNVVVNRGADALFQSPPRAGGAPPRAQYSPGRREEQQAVGALSEASVNPQYNGALNDKC